MTLVQEETQMVGVANRSVRVCVDIIKLVHVYVQRSAAGARLPHIKQAGQYFGQCHHFFVFLHV